MRRRAALAVFATVLGGCVSMQPQAPSAPPVSAEPTTTEAPRVATFPVIHFDSGKLVLSLEQRHKIREISETLKQSSLAQKRVLVIGHTDAQGNTKMNHKIGLKRAKAVAAELVFNGILFERLLVESRGENEPLAPNVLPNGSDNLEGRALNRRVEIALGN